jgi:hypothetical protein
MDKATSISGETIPMPALFTFTSDCHFQRQYQNIYVALFIKHCLIKLFNPINRMYLDGLFNARVVHDIHLNSPNAIGQPIKLLEIPRGCKYFESF